MVYVLVGLPGSGKTTWAKNVQANLKAAIVSRDMVRFSIYGLEFDRHYEDKVNQIFWSIYLTLLDLKEEIIIIDCTNLRKQTRLSLINAAHQRGFKVIAVVFDIDSEICWQRKHSTGSAMKYEEFQIMAKAYEPVSQEEGFEEIIRADNLGKE